MNNEGKNQDTERRLARTEKRANFAIVYSCVALVCAMAQPWMFNAGQGLGLSTRLTDLVTAVFVGLFGAFLAGFMLKRTSD
jgi:hypothetical protein